MNICQSLIEAASRSRKALGGRKQNAVRILLERRLPDGGFRGKGQTSDLYYTGFAVLSLLALQADFESGKTIRFVERLTFTDQADLAHFAAWVRLCRLLRPGFFTEAVRTDCLKGLERFRCQDGAWHHLGCRETGSAYGCFLVLGALQDTGAAWDQQFQSDILKCLSALKSGNGGYFNEADIPAVSVPATAAAIVSRRILMQPTESDSDAQTWLMRNYDAGDEHSGEHSPPCPGGFRVMPIAPVADLLSTAVALHALSLCRASLDTIRPSCLKYVNSLWDDRVGFCANSLDRISDAEYMFYGLLSLGHLADDR